MNVFPPQNEQTRVECEEILSTTANFMSGQQSKPMLSIKQDGMTGGFKMTYNRVQIPKHIFYDCIMFDEWSLEFIHNKIEHIKLVHKWTKLFDMEFDKLKYDFPNKSEEELKQLAEDNLLYTGHSLFSMLLPDDFEYSCNNLEDIGITGVKDPVFITRGVMIQGTLSKKAMGSSSGSLMHHIAKDYGLKRATEFVGYYQMLINNWFSNYGFSIGVKDCVTTEEKVVKDIIDSTMLNIYSIMETQKDPELLEFEIQHALNEAIKTGNSKVKDAFNKDNAFVSMIYSGAKGKAANITQIGGIVGQQNLNGRRVPKTYGGRTLPHYVKQSNLQNEPDKIDNSNNMNVIDNLNQMLKLTESRGFIRNSFYRGLSPVDMFFQSAAAREGLVDSNAKTPETGYIQRRIIHMIEDLKWSYNNTIVNSRNTILDFCYGTDNIDPAYMISVGNGVYSFIDIKHTVDCLNKNFEWNRDIQLLKKEPLPIIEEEKEVPGTSAANDAGSKEVQVTSATRGVGSKEEKVEKVKKITKTKKQPKKIEEETEFF